MGVLTEKVVQTEHTESHLPNLATQDRFFIIHHPPMLGPSFFPGLEINAVHSSPLLPALLTQQQLLAEAFSIFLSPPHQRSPLGPLLNPAAPYSQLCPLLFLKLVALEDSSSQFLHW